MIAQLSEFTRIPFYYGTKIPATKWKRFVGKKVPEPLIKVLFKGILLRNVGIIVEKNLAVIDFDDRRLYHEWCDVNPALSGTLTVETGRGYHSYFYVEDGTFPVRTERGIDVKTNGIVMIPPSMHPNGNTFYKVAKDSEIQTVPDMDGLGVDFSLPTYTRSANGLMGLSPIEQCVERLPLYPEISRLTILKRVNGGWRGLCPFHEDTVPSLFVYDDDHFYCFGDGCWANRRRDIVDLVAAKNRCNINRAIEIILEEK